MTEDGRYSYEMSLDVFLQALAVLAEPPEQACKTYGFYNVAWELKEDLLSAEYLLGSQYAYFSPEQREQISALLHDLHQLPDAATSFTRTAQESVENMLHDAWESPREKAIRLLLTLEDVLAKNTAYLNSPSSSGLSSST